jgi:hypothetical protein
MLDRLQAADLIAWGRGETTLAIVVSPEARKQLGAADRIAADATRRKQ